MLLLSDFGWSECTWRWDCWSMGFRWSVVWRVLFLSLYIKVSKNDVLLYEILCSNLIALCLLFKFSKNISSSCLVPVYIMNISSIYRKYSIDLFLLHGYICCFSNCAMKIFAYVGGQSIPMHIPLFVNNLRS